MQYAVFVYNAHPQTKNEFEWILCVFVNRCVGVYSVCVLNMYMYILQYNTKLLYTALDF